MKKKLILCIGLIILAVSVSGQEIPKLKVTEREMTGRVFRCAENNQTVVEIQSNVELDFESTMDKVISYCNKREESGFIIYELLFPTNSENKKYDGRKLKIKSRGFEEYLQPLDLKAKVPVGLLVINETKRQADAFYDAGEYANALKEYEKLRAITPNDNFIVERIAACKNSDRRSISVEQTSSKTSQSKGFALNKSTRIGIQQKNVSPNWKFVQMLEETFLNKGYNVLPAEVLIISNQNNSANGTVSTHSTKYIPAAILISLTPSGGGGALIVTIIDLKDQRLLFSGKYTSLTSRSVVNSFIKDITPFME